jgi:hypothetical protein
MTTLPKRPTRPSDNIATSLLLERARSMSMQTFVSRPEARHILLVRLSVREESLGEELQRAFGVGARLCVETSKVVDITTYTQSILLDDTPGDSAVLKLQQLEVWASVGVCFPAPIMAGGARGGSVTVGRERGTDLCLRRKSISREHAVFEPDRGGDLWLSDLGSSNGTFVDSRQLSPGERVLLAPATPVRFGRAECIYLPPDFFWMLVHGPL